MTSYNRDGKVGPWAEDKLECLTKYLGAYTVILRKYNFDGYFYVDAFAGAGKAEVRNATLPRKLKNQLLLDISEFWEKDQGEAVFLDGSPKIALDIEHPFTRYIFIERNLSRAKNLEALKQQYKNSRKIDVVSADASKALRHLVLNEGINWKANRAVVFLDPFGMQVPWEVIEILARTGAIEVFLNLPVGMAIQRKLPKSGRFSDEDRKMLTYYFGSPDWEDILYKKTPDLFGEIEINKVDHSGERLARWYCARLKKLFGNVSQPYLICNSQGSHLYYLMFAGPKAAGAKIASDIFLRQGKKIPKN